MHKCKTKEDLEARARAPMSMSKDALALGRVWDLGTRPAMCHGGTCPGKAQWLESNVFIGLWTDGTRSLRCFIWSGTRARRANRPLSASSIVSMNGGSALQPHALGALPAVLTLIATAPAASGANFLGPELYNFDSGNLLHASLKLFVLQRCGGMQPSVLMDEMLLQGCFGHPVLVGHL